MKNMLEYNHAVKKSTGIGVSVLPFRHYAVNFGLGVPLFTLYSFSIS